jgi:hypothetical protein
MGCYLNPVTETNTATGTNLNSFGSTGTVRNTITPTRSSTGRTLQTVSTVQKVDLLGGLIQASQVTGVATSTLSTTQSKSVGTGSAFSGLRVAGLSITTTPAPNTKIALPGLGYVILNKQNNFVNRSNVTGITIDMIDVVVNLSNNKNIPVGTEITVAHAYSYIVHTAAPVIVNAQARSLSGEGLGSLSFSPAASADISCGGDTIHNQLTSITSSTASTGVTTADTTGNITAYYSTATSSASISNLNLLNGFIKADAINAKAQVSWHGTNTGSGTKQGTVSFTNAKIGNSSFSGTPYPNSWVSIPGLGYVILNEQFGSLTSSNTSEEVYALDLHVTQSNSFGLPVGARIIVDDVHAGVTGYTAS